MSHPRTVVWLTGLPAAGKTTLGTALRDALAQGGTPALLLDGDELRRTVSADLGFGPAARAEQARRVTGLALEAVQPVALIALVSPFRADRAAARASVGRAGARFVEVHVDAPAAECARRDPKGLWAQAADGERSGLTGWDAPYEAPPAPEVHLAPDGEGRMPSVAAATRTVLDVVLAEGASGVAGAPARPQRGGGGASAPGK